MKRVVVWLSVAVVVLSVTACRGRRVEVRKRPTPSHPVVVVEETKVEEKAAKPTPEIAPAKPVEPIIPLARPTESKLRLPKIFSDNMVLQQDGEVPVWGWANDGEVVTVRFGGQTVTALPKNGRWQVSLKNLKASYPGTFTVSGLKTITFTNVVVGEVWVCSGQSNMEWPLFKSHEPEETIATSSNAMIRLFQVPHKRSDTPLPDLLPDEGVTLGWHEARPETVKNFSAVGYYFGRELHLKLGVPIGLIQTTWGGTPAEVWMGEDVLRKSPRYRAEVLGAYEQQMAAYTEALRDYEKKQQEVKENGSTRKLTPPRTPWKPAELFNAMVHPIVPYGIKGTIWYQGESNASAGRTEQYVTLFQDLIKNWREIWGLGKFPFLFVQLAPFKAIQPQPMESEWAELREAQLKALQHVPHTGMAVITDLGEERDIHPTQKAQVGERLALSARAVAYGEDIVSSGPIYKGSKIDGNKVIVSFDHVGSGLVARGGSVKGFSVAGADRKFIWARAEIMPDNKVAVWSPNVNEPVAVRYGWADFPVVNLWNKEGLPASPFRTDNFPHVQPK